MNTQLSFQNTQFNIINHNNQIWLSSKKLASALSYASSKSVTDIYNKNSDEFTCAMSQVVESTTLGNYRKKVIVFSLRGAHLIAMFARTSIAKEFRKWVLDVLDKAVATVPIVKPAKQTHRYYIEVKIIDNLLGGSIIIPGKSNTFKQIASGLSESLGYKPTSFVTVPNATEELMSRRI